MRYYLIEILGDVEPILRGPFTSDEERFEHAKEIHDPDNGLFMLNLSIDPNNPDCGYEAYTLDIGAFAGGDFEDD